MLRCLDRRPAAELYAQRDLPVEPPIPPRLLPKPWKSLLSDPLGEAHALNHRARRVLWL